MEGLNVLYHGYSELREIPARQVPGEPPRRWFMSAKCDLVVWLGADGLPIGFQFCYGKDEQEHALTYSSSSGGRFSHTAVDSGVPSGTETPLLVPNGAVDPARILETFTVEARAVPDELAAWVTDRLRVILADHRDSAPQ